MKTIYQFSILALLFFAGAPAPFPQNRDWSVESPLVTINATDVEIDSVLTKQGDTLTWQQNGYNTNSSSTFGVTSATGSWDSQSRTGQLAYGLSMDGGTATLEVTGTAGDITVVLTIGDDTNGHADSYTFLVETATNL